MPSTSAAWTLFCRHGRAASRLGVAVHVHEVDDALPRRDVLGLYIPVQPGEIRPSRDTSVISLNTSPAPPTARLPR